MYTILLDSSNELKTTISENIVRRNKNVDFLHFLVVPTYKGMDMSEFTVTMEYILPVSQEYHMEILTLSDELYKEYLEYKLPFDTNLTKEAGNVSVQLTFTKVQKEVTDEGEQVKQYTRHTTPTVIKIFPSASWSDMIPDSALSAMDQRILKLDALANQLSENQELALDGKADDISYEDNTIQLLANGKKIGTKHKLDGQKEFDIVDFGDSENTEPDDDEYTLVEF